MQIKSNLPSINSRNFTNHLTNCNVKLLRVNGKVAVESLLYIMATDTDKIPNVTIKRYSCWFNKCYTIHSKH